MAACLKHFSQHDSKDSNEVDVLTVDYLDLD